MKQIKFWSRTGLVLCTMYIVMYAFRSNMELVPVFQSTGTLVPFRFPAGSDRNVPPRMFVGGVVLMLDRILVLFLL